MRTLFLILMALSLYACKQEATDHGLNKHYVYKGKPDPHDESVPWRDEQLRKRVRQIQADR